MTEICGKTEHERALARSGVLYGVAAYVSWGLAPIYFKVVAHVSPLEILCHRVLWSMLFLLMLVLGTGRVREAVKSFSCKRTVLILLVTTTLIASNWFVFIWCVTNNQVLQASLAYFICPLVTVALGRVFLKEKLRFWQTISVLLAIVGVLCLVVMNGELPWIALVLALTFSFYGLLRKVTRVEAMVGLTAETCLLFPIALGCIVYWYNQGISGFGLVSVRQDLLLAAAGPVTALPLLWFSYAARRVRLSTLGFLQYLAPTGQFLMALYYGESFTLRQGISFGFIWAALAVYSWDALNKSKRSSGN